MTYKHPYPDHHSSSAQPETKQNFGKRPVAGQRGNAYVSGANAHGVHQKRTKAPEPGSKSGNAAASQPKKQTY